MKHDVTVELAGGKPLHFKTGRMARAGLRRRAGDPGRFRNRLLATAVASPDPREGIRFFPPYR